jgi:hypothetical protein
MPPYAGDASPSTAARALATIGTGALAPVLDLSLPRMQSFADRHGYDVVVGAGDSDGRPPAWGKITLLRRLLDTYDAVLWIDADVLIVDELEDVPALRPGAFQGLVEQRKRETVANTGVWSMRSCDESRSFLEAVWERSDRIDHPWWEQAAVLDLLGYADVPNTKADPPTTRHQTRTPWYDATQFLPAEWNCLYPPWMRDTDNPRFWHFAGMPNEDRITFMRIESRRRASGADLVYRKLLSAKYRVRRLKG